MARLETLNGLLTMIPYRDSMPACRSFAMRLLVLAIATLVGIGLLKAEEAKAQSATVDWANAGVASQGSFPSPTNVTGSDGTVATVTWSSQTQGAGSFDPAFAPTFVSYFSGTIGSGPSPLLLSFDNSSYDPRDKITVDITLSRAVTGLNFSLGDIDSGSFADAVEIYYDDDSSGSFTNAATNTIFWSTGSSVTRTNDTTVNGWRGTAGSATTSTNGNVNMDFGSQAVQRIRIVYFSYTGTGDPTAQFAGVSDLNYAATGADLSLTKVLFGSPPVQGGTATWLLTVTNNASSDQSASGITVRETFPGGFTFSSASGTGTFDSSTRVWNVGTLAPGASASLTIRGTISSTAGTTVTNVAEITASSASDPDSTVNNGVTTEDDYALVSFVVQTGRSPGVPPVLSCPAGRSVFDWDAITGWVDGTTDNSYAFGTFGNARFQLTNDGAYLTNATFGGQNPTVHDYFTGGLSPAENTLTVVSNQTNQAGEVTITITLPRSFTGIQFSIFDVDFGSGQFADRVTVTGLNGSTAVTPSLTNGNVNYVSGGSVIGDGSSGAGEALGNVVVTFTQAVDTITVRYGNHTTAPADPGQQGIGLHDIAYCLPNASLDITKVSSVISDPVNGGTNPKAIPGALIEYLITVTNTGSDTPDTDSVIVTDDSPSDAKLCLVDFGGGSGPVRFTAGSPSPGLTYTYSALGSSTDDLEFSSDGGSTWTYAPTADADGCDSNVSDFRVNPKGSFAGSTNFSLRVRFIVE